MKPLFAALVALTLTAMLFDTAAQASPRAAGLTNGNQVDSGCIVGPITDGHA
jgi:hypothetical protein